MNLAYPADRLPFWFAFALPADLRILLVFRLVRFSQIGSLLVGPAGRAPPRAARLLRLR
jgi:hypothetical protein